MVELLSPVQDFVSLHAAINSGADAVYFGVNELNMRANAKNFRLSDILRVVKLCHQNNVKAYLTLNSIIYDSELLTIKKILNKAKKAKIDAIIAWDFAIITQANKLNIPIHISTQASVSNISSIKTLKKNYKNIDRVVLARELTLTQIKKIIKRLKKEKILVGVETFIHGAMCVSISGRCFMSQDVFGKSANRGECLQNCRRMYEIKDVEESHSFSLGTDYVLSPKDICALPILSKLQSSGIVSFKIEGRNRSPEYVKTVTEVYREAIDNKKHDVKKLMRKLRTVYNRGFSTGFYMGKPINGWSKSYGSCATKKKIYIGVVKNFFKKLNVAEVRVESHGIKKGDQLMVQGNKTGVHEQKLNSLKVNRKPVNYVKKGLVCIKLNKIIRENDKVYIIK